MIGLSLSDSTCNDGTVCAGISLCCARPSGYGCCPFPAGTCCLDGNSCCPNEYLCGNNKCSSKVSSKLSLFQAIEEEFIALIPSLAAIPSLGTVIKCVIDIPRVAAAIAQISNDLKSGDNTTAVSHLHQLGINGNALVTDCAAIISLAPGVSAALKAKFPLLPDLPACPNDLKPLYTYVTLILTDITNKNNTGAFSSIPQLLADGNNLIGVCEKVIKEMIY